MHVAVRVREAVRWEKADTVFRDPTSPHEQTQQLQVIPRPKAQPSGALLPFHQAQKQTAPCTLINGRNTRFRQNMSLLVPAECGAFFYKSTWTRRPFHNNLPLNRNVDFPPDASQMKNANFTTSYYLEIIINKIMNL